MFVDCLKRHLAVCAMRDLPFFARRDPNFWNVISLLGPEAPTPPKIGFREQHRAFFHDVRAAEAAGGDAKLVDTGTLRAILQFVDDRPSQPILVHCVAGISRSPAVALVLLLRGVPGSGTIQPVSEAIETLLNIRPQARPNPLVVRAGLGCFLPSEEAGRILAKVLSDPRMVREKARETRDEE